MLEQWGAVQLQNRFEKSAKRNMQSRDFASFTAIRAIGEAVTRSGKTDAADVPHICCSGFPDGWFKAGRSASALSMASCGSRSRWPMRGRW